MGSRGANPGISKRRPFGRLLPGHPSKLWTTHVSHTLSLVLACRIVKDERWIRATRARTEMECLVKVESGSVRGSGVCVDSGMAHLILIIKAIAEPRRSMPGIRGYAGVVRHQHKGTSHCASIPSFISVLSNCDVEDAVKGLGNRARYHAGRWRPDVKRRDGVMKIHRAGLRTISLSYWRAGESLSVGGG